MPDLKTLPYSTEKVVLRNKNLFTTTVDNNEAHKRYFSSIDAEIYFGDIFIDDINRIEYHVVEKILPIYGYNSSVFDFLLYGSRHIEGEFTINFTKSGWLLDCIKGLGSVVGVGNTGINQCCERKDSCGTTSKGLFDGVFDIIVSFGDHKSSIRSFGSSAHMIKGVRINGYSQMLDTSGEPIGETYRFIAQDIDFDIDTTGGLDNTFTTGNNNTFISHVEGLQNKKSLINVAYNKNEEELLKARNAVNEGDVLALAVDASYSRGNITSSINILNDDIKSSDITINKITLTSNDRRADFRSLPIMKTTDYKRLDDSSIESVFSLDSMPMYDKKLSKLFNHEGDKGAVDVNVSLDILYKDIPFVINSQPIKITLNDSYNA